MFSFNVRTVQRGVLAAMMVGLAACSDEQGKLLTDVGADPAASVAAKTAPANQQLARLVALALREPGLRTAFYQGTTASPVKEGKLHLATYLRGSGAPLLRAMARQGDMTEAQVLQLLDQTGSMEIYLPVEAHRAVWKGGNDLIVATTMDDKVVPFGVDLNGQPVQLSLKTAPDVPAISIVPAESFDALGKPYGRDVQSRQNASAQDLGPSFSVMGTTWTGLWANEVHVGHDYESWALGKPEFEMYIERADDRTPIVCISEFKSVEPYHFNMDGLDYYDPFLLAAEGEIPEGVKFVVSMWEDDKEPCKLLPESGRDWVKDAVDALKNAYGAVKSVQEKGWVDTGWIIKAYQASIAVKGLIEGNDDDFVGVSAGEEDVSNIAKVFRLKNTNAENTGWISVQYESRDIQ